MTDGPVVITLGVSVDLVGAEVEDNIEFTREEWEGWTVEERRKVIEEELEIHVSNHMDQWAKFANPEDDPRP